MNMGRNIVPEILSREQIPHEIHTEHLPDDAADQDWIELCSREGWIGITKDLRLKYNSYITQVIKRSPVAIFGISTKNLTGQQMGELLVKAYPKICKFVTGNKKPFLATLSINGNISKVKF